MDDHGLESVRKDVREGRIDADRLVDLLVTSQRQLQESKKRIEELERALERLQKQAGAGKVAEPYAMRAEEKRQQAKQTLDKKRQRRKKAPVRQVYNPVVRRSACGDLSAGVPHQA